MPVLPAGITIGEDVGDVVAFGCSGRAKLEAGGVVTGGFCTGKDGGVAVAGVVVVAGWGFIGVVGKATGVVVGFFAGASGEAGGVVVGLAAGA